MNQFHKTQMKQEDKRHKLSLYIHIPFCVKKCDYCDFLSGPADESTRQRYFEALQREIQSYADRMDNYEVTTIFFGGGTPSSVEAAHIKNIMDTIKKVFNVCEEQPRYIEADSRSSIRSDKVTLEATIEVNPGTITREKLLVYQEAGINRLSFGLQSTLEKELKLLGRIHSYEQFERNYTLARELGFQNINIDLMSALPGQTLSAWETTLHKVISLNPEHISAYSLIIEEGTPFFDRYGEGAEAAYELPDEETDRLMYLRTKEILAEYGYHRYEISNYAKDGYECRHNLTYWQGTEYLGLGLGASSLLQNTRFHNISEIEEYIKVCNEYCNNNKNAPLGQSEVQEQTDRKDILGIRREVVALSTEQQMEEFMFLGLRILRGISREAFLSKFHVEIETVYKEVLDRLTGKHLLEDNGKYLYLTEYGIDISNQVLAEFLLD